MHDGYLGRYCSSSEDIYWMGPTTMVHCSVLFLKHHNGPVLMNIPSLSSSQSHRQTGREHRSLLRYLLLHIYQMVQTGEIENLYFVARSNEDKLRTSRSLKQTKIQSSILDCVLTHTKLLDYFPQLARENCMCSANTMDASLFESFR